MTQRNPMNPRTQNKAYKGASRRSASSAKPSREAGSSVRVVPKDVKAKQSRKQRSAEDKAEEKRERQRETVLMANASSQPEYKKWRKRWMVVIGIAVVAVVVSFIINWLASSGAVAEDMSTTVNGISIGVLVVGYIMIAFALYIDFRKIRPIRKAEQARARTLSKSEKRALDEAIARSEAAKEEMKKDAKKGGIGHLPWSRGRAGEADGGSVTDDGGSSGAQKASGSGGKGGKSGD